MIGCLASYFGSKSSGNGGVDLEDILRKIDNKQSEYETKLENQRNVHNKELEEQKNDYETKLGDQKSDYETKLKNQRNVHNKELEEQKKDYETKLKNSGIVVGKDDLLELFSGMNFTRDDLLTAFNRSKLVLDTIESNTKLYEANEEYRKSYSLFKLFDISMHYTNRVLPCLVPEFYTLSRFGDYYRENLRDSILGRIKGDPNSKLSVALSAVDRFLMTDFRNLLNPGKDGNYNYWRIFLFAFALYSILPTIYFLHNWARSNEGVLSIQERVFWKRSYLFFSRLPILSRVFGFYRMLQRVVGVHAESRGESDKEKRYTVGKGSGTFRKLDKKIKYIAAYAMLGHGGHTLVDNEVSPEIDNRGGIEQVPDVPEGFCAKAWYYTKMSFNAAVDYGLRYGVGWREN